MSQLKKCARFQYRKRYDSARNKISLISLTPFDYSFNTVNGMTVHVIRIVRKQCFRKIVCFNTVNGMTVHVIIFVKEIEAKDNLFQYRKRYDSARNSALSKPLFPLKKRFNTVNGMTVHVISLKAVISAKKAEVSIP